MRSRTVFQRVRQGPLLSVDDMPFPAAAVLNPGAAIHDDQVVLLLRIEDTTGRSNIHVARSPNGVDNWSIETRPILAYGDPQWHYEAWGCEDPRLTYVPEQHAWYITYTAASPFGPAVALARSTDLHTAERVGLIFAPNNKDAVLFPEKVNGKFVVFHRPDAGGIEHVWSAYSSDLIHWGQPHCVLTENAGPAWDAAKVGAGPPPILTHRGWLLVYHGVKQYGGRFLYRAGLAVFDHHHPNRLLQRSPSWVFQAHEPFEFEGLTPGVVFPSGLLQRGDELWMYYGAADTSVGLAVAKLADVLAALDEA